MMINDKTLYMPESSTKTERNPKLVIYMNFKYKTDDGKLVLQTKL